MNRFNKKPFIFEWFQLVDKLQKLKIMLTFNFTIVLALYCLFYNMNITIAFNHSDEEAITTKKSM